MQNQLQEPPSSPQRPAMMTILLFSLTILVFLGGVSLVYYTTFYNSTRLSVQATADTHAILLAQAHATFAASPQFMYQELTHKPPTTSDPLDGIYPSSWITHARYQTACVFIDGAYHAQVGAQSSYVDCLNPSDVYTNFVLQVQITFIHGNNASILFRASNPNVGYFFIVTNNGYYALVLQTESQDDKILIFGHSPAIHSGSGQANTFTVIAQRNTMSFYVNKQFLRSVTDNTFDTGTLGFEVGNAYQQTVDIAFSNLQIWKL